MLVDEIRFFSQKEIIAITQLIVESIVNYYSELLTHIRPSMQTPNQSAHESMTCAHARYNNHLRLRKFRHRGKRGILSLAGYLNVVTILLDFAFILTVSK